MTTEVRDTCATEPTHAGARHFRQVAELHGFGGEGTRGLIAGCGVGHEARYLRRHVGASLVGFDFDVDAVAAAARGGGLPVLAADVAELPFRNDVFDFVFYHHVIEHVARPAASLAELARVLRPGGWLYVGTPNRHRIVGYVGAHASTLRHKIKLNLKDYAARLRGRFRNEAGAHAGFSQRELQEMLSRHFRESVWMTGDYLNFKYGGRVPAPILAPVTRSPLRGVMAPAIYALCRK